MKEYDYLIIGGGSAGSIIARRLAEANIGSVLLIEAGKSDENDPAITHLSRLDEQSDETEWGFTASPTIAGHNDIHYSRAKMLGGCGNHNDCAFLIPAKQDFDQWNSLGATGWSWSDVAPYFDKVDNKVCCHTAPPVGEVSEVFVNAAKELGLPWTDFRKSVTQGVGVFPLNSKGNLRQSSSIAYLHPLSALPKNLSVMCDTTVTKLKVNKHRVIGCETSSEEILANKEVILCCGAIQTPQLLMVSGIGPADHLADFDIQCLHNIKAIGRNLMDHSSANIVMQLEQPPQWQLTLCEVSLLLQTHSNEPAPDLLYHFVLGGRNKYINLKPDYDPNLSVKISPNVTRPKSRGWVNLQSAQITDQPDIQLNYYSDADDYDMKTMIKGLKFSRQLAQTSSFSSLTDNEILPGKGVCTDKELANYIRNTCETVYHPAGTCKMGNPNDEDTVVDCKLHLKGLDNLRICDASVFPSMVTVNINNTVMMVAEKAADLIIEENRSVDK